MLELVFNVLWLCWSAGDLPRHLVTGAVLCITIIGIPFGIQAFKLSVLALWPFGRTVVSEGDAAAHPVG